MATNDEETPAASTEDWLALESACSSSAFARCLIKLRDCFLGELPPRVAALEAAMEAAWRRGEIGPSLRVEELTRAVERRGEIPSVPGISGHAPTPAAAPAGGVTVRELANALERLIDDAPRDVVAYILKHPKIAHLLRGKRVVLAEHPPALREPGPNDLHFVWPGYRDGWAAARAEVARQQGE